MMRKYICYVILVTFNHAKRCGIKTQSGHLWYACCADYEKKGNDCIPCSIGYTSRIGQSCRPCQHNVYGEGCGYYCFCSPEEICDNVHGCVIPLTPTSTLVYETSDKMTSTLNLETTSNGENIDSSVQGLLSKVLVACFILSAFVIVFGIGFGFVSCKYMALTKQKKSTIIQSQNPTIPQNSQNIEMENRLYDIINEIDMLDDQQVQQLEMSPVYVDVIDDSSIREGCESKRFENHDNPCQLISTVQTHIQENSNLKVDCRSIISGDSTSSYGEYHQDSTQDYLNPYQYMIQSEMLPLEVSEYLTLAPDNSRIDSGNPSHQKISKKNNLQYPRVIQNNAMAKSYENVLDVACPNHF